jgi:excisionase family DNA binding protein
MEYLTVLEVAEILQVNKFTIYRWSKSGKIPSRVIGGRVLRFLASDIEAFTRPLNMERYHENDK